MSAAPALDRGEVAGPGAILAAVLMTENSRYGVSAQIETTIVMLSVVAFAGACMLAAGRINRVIGSAGASVVSRVMGLILAAVAVNDTLKGLQLFFESALLQSVCAGFSRCGSSAVAGGGRAGV